MQLDVVTGGGRTSVDKTSESGRSEEGDLTEVHHSDDQLARSFVILTGGIKALTSDNKSATSWSFCLQAKIPTWLVSQSVRSMRLQRQHP
jgi:hypothetical protein